MPPCLPAMRWLLPEVGASFLPFKVVPSCDRSHSPMRCDAKGGVAVGTQYCCCDPSFTSVSGLTTITHARSFILITLNGLVLLMLRGTSALVRVYNIFVAPCHCLLRSVGSFLGTFNGALSSLSMLLRRVVVLGYLLDHYIVVVCEITGGLCRALNLDVLLNMLVV